MASGRLGVADLSATTNTVIYTVPTGKTASFTVNVCNRATTAATVRLALAANTSSVNASEYIEFDTGVSGNGVLERTGLMLDAGKGLVAYSNANSISVVAYGVEE